MRFVSTRGSPRIYSFVQAAVTGVADDGGLLLPEGIPGVPLDIQKVWRKLSFPGLLERILHLFIDGAEENSLASELAEALPRLISATFAKLEREALDVQVVRLLNRRQRQTEESLFGDGEPCGSCDSGKPEICPLFRRAACERSSKIYAMAEQIRRNGFHSVYALSHEDNANSSADPQGQFGGIRLVSTGVSRHPELQRKRAISLRTSLSQTSADSNSGQPMRPPCKELQPRGSAGHDAPSEADEVFFLSAKNGAKTRLNDVALKFTAELLKFLQERPRTKLHLITLCATTGATGLGAAEALKNQPSMELVVLFPKEIRAKRRSQLAAFDAPNVFCVEVDGTYAQCKAMVQGALRSRRLQRHLTLQEHLSNKQPGKEAPLALRDAAVSLGRGEYESVFHRTLTDGVERLATSPRMQQSVPVSVSDRATRLPSRTYTKRFAQRRETGSFVHLSSQEQKIGRSSPVSFMPPHPTFNEAQPFRLCLIAPFNCVRICTEIAFWWFAALRLQSFRQKQEANALESANGGPLTRQASNATASAALAGVPGAPGVPRQTPHSRVGCSPAHGPPQNVFEGAPLPAESGKRDNSDALPLPKVLVPSGSFSLLFSAYFALAMGAPFGGLIPCVSASSVVKELRRSSIITEDEEDPANQTSQETADIQEQTNEHPQGSGSTEGNAEGPPSRGDRRRSSDFDLPNLRPSRSSKFSRFRTLLSLGAKKGEKAGEKKILPKVSNVSNQDTEKSAGEDAGGLQEKTNQLKLPIAQSFKGIAKNVNLWRQSSRIPLLFTGEKREQHEGCRPPQMEEEETAKLEGPIGHFDAAVLLRKGGERVVDIAQLMVPPGSRILKPSFLGKVTQLVLPDVGIPFGTDEESKSSEDVKEQPIKCQVIAPQLAALEDFLIELFCPESEHLLD